MSSKRRSQASRQNGARSRGPVTPEGQSRSSRNAIKHGLLSRCIVLETEREDLFDHLYQQFLERFQPSDVVEIGFVEEMAAATWRLRRIWTIETRMLDEATAAQPLGDNASRMTAAWNALAASPQFQLLQRYEARLHRNYHRALENILLIRNREVPDPAPLSPLGACQCRPYPPLPDFDLPNEPEIAPETPIPPGSDPSRPTSR